MAEAPNCLPNNCSFLWTEHSLYSGRQYPLVKISISQSLVSPERVMWPNSSQWDASGSNGVLGKAPGRGRLGGQVRSSPSWFLLPRAQMECGHPWDHGDGREERRKEAGSSLTWGAFTPALDCPPSKSAYVRENGTPNLLKTLLGLLCGSQVKAMRWKNIHIFCFPTFYYLHSLYKALNIWD